MRTVKVDRNDLLERVVANRDNHARVFEEAWAGYTRQVVADMEENLALAKAGKEWRVHIGLVRPADHTDDYDQVIQMLEMSEDTSIELTYQEFAQYVRDDWGWRREWAATTAGYVSEATAKDNKLK